MSYDRASARQVLNRIQAEKRSSLTPAESKILCDAYGIPLPQEAIAGSPEEAARLAAEIGFPVVMKIISPDILHKTDAGGVVVGVKSPPRRRRLTNLLFATPRRTSPRRKSPASRFSRCSPAVRK